MYGAPTYLPLRSAHQSHLFNPVHSYARPNLPKISTTDEDHSGGIRLKNGRDVAPDMDSEHRLSQRLLSEPHEDTLHVRLNMDNGCKGDNRRDAATDMDPEQRLSQQLLADPGQDVFPAGIASAPEHALHPKVTIPSPISTSFSQGDIALSPAAMFLSAFSPSASVTSMTATLPDDDGQEVGGYTLGAIIGYGGFSTIRKASSLTGGTVAVKIVRRSDISKQDNPSLVRKRLSHEASVWSDLSHEHILPLFSAVHTAYADFFVTLYCPAGTLFDILQREGGMAQDDAGTMFRQVVRGLRYLHEIIGLVHRDIKLENVLVDETGVCRIGDFGMTTKIGELDDDAESDERLQHDEERQEYQRQRAQSSIRQTKPAIPTRLSIIRHHSGPRHRNSSPLPSSAAAYPATQPSQSFNPGSLPYASPELLLPHSSPLPPHPAQDIWALGVLLYTLLTGRLPFMDLFEPRLQMKILHGVYDVPEDIGRGAEQILKGCLERSVSSRWTIAMVDEVAWGVGWGAAGDNVTPSTDEIRAFETQRRSRPQSRSRKHTSGSVLMSGGRASHSPSRPRSLSQTGTGRAAFSSTHSSPSFSALTDSILSSTSSSTFSSSSSVPTLQNDSALLTSPPSTPEPLHERGRRPRYHHQHESRSPSPSIVPLTPVDLVDVDGKGKETSRGRRAFRRDVPSPLGLDHLAYDRAGIPGLGLDVVDEKTQWCSSPGRTSRGREESSVRRVDRRHRNKSGDKRGRRPDSMPPVGSSPWSLMSRDISAGGATPSVKFSPSHGVGEFVMTPKPASGRSKSLGAGHRFAV